MIGYASSVCPFFISYSFSDLKIRKHRFFCFRPIRFRRRFLVAERAAVAASARARRSRGRRLSSDGIVRLALSAANTKKARTFRFSLRTPSLKGSTALLAVGGRVLAWTSLGGRRYPSFRHLTGHKAKREELSFFPFSTPSGARTLDPNIKSVVLYQLS